MEEKLLMEVQRICLEVSLPYYYVWRCTNDATNSGNMVIQLFATDSIYADRKEDGSIMYEEQKLLYAGVVGVR